MDPAQIAALAQSLSVFEATAVSDCVKAPSMCRIGHRRQIVRNTYGR